MDGWFDDDDFWQMYYEQMGGGPVTMTEQDAIIEKKLSDVDYREWCVALQYLKDIKVIQDWQCFVSSIEKGKFVANANRWAVGGVSHKHYSFYHEDPVEALRGLYKEIMEDRL